MLDEFDFLDDFNRFAEIILSAQEMVNEYRRQQSESDRVVNEIYHEIEKTNFHVVDGYKLAKRLQTALRRRRNIKIKLAVAQMLFELHRATHPHLKKTQESIEHLVHRYVQYENHFREQGSSYTNGVIEHAK